jgi:FKBP-type peptidyl-prolyl cis-trans isomerase FkpA
MLRIVLSLFTIVIFSGSCIKKDNGCPYTSSDIIASTTEQQAVMDYLTANSITATKHPNGMYYEILAPGSGGSPHLCSQVVVAYNGKLTNGTQFDASSNLVYELGALIEGWKLGLPLIQKNGHIMLYIPPSQGYGATDVKDGGGNVIIPKNSVLIFDVTLKDFN